VSKSLVAGVTVVALLVGGLGFTLISPRALGAKTHQLQITFPTADGLVAGSDVLEAGAKVGTISDIQPTQDSSALVTMEIQDQHWPLHNGLAASIRPKSLLGEKYVDVHDGPTANAVFDAAQVLHETEKAVPVELDQFINSLDEPTRNAARVLLNDLGAGVAGRGQALNEAIASGKANLANLATFGTTLNNRNADLDRILVGLDGVLSKITTSDQLTQLSQLISNGQQTLNAIESQQAAFSRQFVDAQTALGELNTAIDSAVPSLRNTLSIAPQLLNSTTQEASMLAFLGSVAADPTTLAALGTGLLHGPTSTGGALENTKDANGNPTTKGIFRICLVQPANGGSNHTCEGQSSFEPQGTQSVPAAYYSTDSHAAMFAMWLAD
jgi:phospholipid/cholesterol/gamma-HCH transport system substrate-binding protein